jgi:dTDP-4-amino-4,6-dideoxygalactose transaminase
MEFFDLKKQYQNLKPEIDASIRRVMESGVFIGGREVEELEKKIAGLLGVRYAVSLNSGTDALFLSLKALGIGAGDEVITTPFTFFATAETIAAVGAKPVFVDIDPATFNVDAAKIETAITKKTKAIMPVHLFGQMADMAAIVKIAKDRNLKIIEDCAQAIGATQKINGKIANAGTSGNVGCFSFFPTKNLGACGDGGMVITNNEDLAREIKLLRSHGSSPEDKYRNLKLGVNSRLDAIQAAILGVKINYLEKWNKERAALADNYNNGLAGVGDVITPLVAAGNVHVYHQYTIRTTKRDALRESLKTAGIPSMIYYALPLHLQPAFEYLGHKAGDFPVCEQAAREVVSLPIYPELAVSDQELIIKAAKKFYANK